MASLTLLRLGALCGALFVGCTCLSYRVPPDLERAVRIFPLPREYAGWWKKTEECSGITRPMRVSFFAVPKVKFALDTTNLRFLGLYWSDTTKDGKRISERIYLAAPWIYTEWLVRHEMLHAILQKDSSIAGHPPEFFRVKCQLMSDMNSKTPSEWPTNRRIIIPDQRIPHIPSINVPTP